MVICSKIDINIDMKNYMKYKEGDEVIILHSHSDDIGKTGVITCVRPSFCKIMIDNKERNHTYGQFMKIPTSIDDILGTPENKEVLKRQLI